MLSMGLDVIKKCCFSGTVNSARVTQSVFRIPLVQKQAPLIAVETCALRTNCFTGRLYFLSVDSNVLAEFHTTSNDATLQAFVAIATDILKHRNNLKCTRDFPLGCFCWCWYLATNNKCATTLKDK